MFWDVSTEQFLFSNMNCKILAVFFQTTLQDMIWRRMLTNKASNRQRMQRFIHKLRVARPYTTSIILFSQQWWPAFQVLLCVETEMAVPLRGCHAGLYLYHRCQRLQTSMAVTHRLWRCGHTARVVRWMRHAARNAFHWNSAPPVALQ